MKTLTVSLSLAFAACSHSPAVHVPAAGATHVRETAAERRITHLPRASRTPLIDREDRIVAAYVETSHTRNPISFIVAADSNQIAKLDGDDPPGLEQRVATYLARGRWAPMHAATPEVVDGDASWDLGGGLHLALTPSVGWFRGDRGNVVGMVPPGIHEKRLACDHTNMTVVAAAYDAQTRLVWVTYRDPDGTDNACAQSQYVELFYYFNPCGYDPTDRLCNID